MSQQHHDSIFDIMKGVAIISVVAGHCSVPIIEGFVNQYHLATFYFIAGYFFAPNYIDNMKSFVFKRIKRLYFPFVGYGLVFLLLHNVFCLLKLYPAGDTYSARDFFSNGLRLLFQLVSFEPFMGAMWFAPSLLMVSIAYLLMRRMSKTYGMKASWGWAILLAIIGFVCIKMHIKNPLCIWNTMVVLMIYHLGAIFKKYQLLQRYINSRTTLLCIALTIYFYISGATIRLQPSEMIYNNPLFFLIVPITGICMVYGVSKWIWKTKMASIIALCGNRSFEIMALHFISFKIVGALHVYIERGGFEHLSDFPVYSKNLTCWTPAYILVGCAFPIAASGFIKIIKSSLHHI